jgi:dienelactone hydrolase
VGGKVAAWAFCMGGALTIAAAVHVPKLAAGVCFYGIPPKEFADPANIRIPFQAHFASKDDWCTPAAVDALEAAMRAAGAMPEDVSLRGRPCLLQRDAAARSTTPPAPTRPGNARWPFWAGLWADPCPHPN